MTEELQRITDGLLQAIWAEADGMHFYRMAARSTGDPQGRQVFERLADEEAHHRQFLERQYRSLKERGEIDQNLLLGQPANLEGPSPIFSAELKRRIGEAHYEMSALSIGIQLELSAIAFYRRQAEQAGAVAVRDFFQTLVEWEQSHYQALLRQQETLKQDYWQASGFAPF